MYAFLMKSTPRSWPEEVRQAARSLYLRRSTVGEVSTTLGVPVRTLYNWVEAGRWDDLLSHEGTEEATARRLAVLIEREAKQADDLREIDTLVTTLERLQRLRLRERGLEGVAEREEGKEKAGGKRKKKLKNDVSHLSEDDFTEAFHKRFFPYQRELLETRKHRNRFSSSPDSSALHGISHRKPLKTPASRVTIRFSCRQPAPSPRFSGRTSSTLRKRLSALS